MKNIKTLRAKQFNDKQYGFRQIILNGETMELTLIPLLLLKPHESVDLKILEELVKSIKTDSVLKKAIAVDRNTRIILDGHHRVKALELIGCSKAPCLLVDYSSPRIVVLSRSGDEELPKDLVIRAGRCGELLPPKASKHMVRVSGHLVHISVIEPEVNMPLTAL
ncbi:MAG: ParB N-terminal domain-containing protein [Candidatus Brockarchaeota archaeon]|nr:ParB N-terminal domain-containing protein [Candidatus Brockarchaeota archaeon]MBO3810125.1 ParB N-terminal domain-containing protein [Candidatus Brockarchaeota archaeon]